jgi:hypothetical protein
MCTHYMQAYCTTAVQQSFLFINTKAQKFFEDRNANMSLSGIS